MANLPPGKSRMPPPLPCLIGVLAGLGLDQLLPWPLLADGYALTVGLLLSGLAAALAVAVGLAFRRYDTPANPTKETTAIIDSGPFRYSRNPVYLVFGLLQLALAFLFNTAWIAALVLPAMWVIEQMVVLREEAYLQAKFGETYTLYRARVRRWL